MTNTIESILAKFVLPITESGCWIWMGCLSPEGYGVVHFENKRWLAHRLLYTHLIGSMPKHLVSDHLCRVRCCVNPRHLELVTPAANVDRGLAKKHSACSQGHAYTPENLYVKKDGSQVCKQCRVEYMRRSHAWLGNPAAKDRIHCPQGHPYSPENTFITKQGYRLCRECGRKKHREWSRRRNAANPKPPQYPSFLGRKHSAESKAQMSAAALGRKHSAETRKKMSQSRQGRIVSEETRAKISEAHKNRLSRMSVQKTNLEKDDAVA